MIETYMSVRVNIMYFPSSPIICSSSKEFSFSADFGFSAAGVFASSGVEERSTCDDFGGEECSRRDEFSAAGVLALSGGEECSRRDEFSAAGVLALSGGEESSRRDEFSPTACGGMFSFTEDEFEAGSN